MRSCSHPLPVSYFLDPKGEPARMVQWCSRCGTLREFKRIDIGVLEAGPWQYPMTLLQRIFGKLF